MRLQGRMAHCSLIRYEWKMATKKKFYAVAAGRTPGIYTQWYGAGGAEEQVNGYPGAVFKGFAGLEEAKAFLDANKGRKRKARQAVKNHQAPKTKSRAEMWSPKPAKKGQVIMYTDGGALGNPGPGGYGVVIINGGRTKEISKGFRLTTNNRMELMACIAGLSALKTAASVVLHSDSKYVINGITKGWAKRWRANGWMRTKKEPAVNPDLWQKLLELCDKHEVEFRWVKGHAGIAGNERCDALAVQAAAGSNLHIDSIYEKSLKR